MLLIVLKQKKVQHHLVLLNNHTRMEPLNKVYHQYLTILHFYMYMFIIFYLLTKRPSIIPVFTNM